MKRLAAVLIVCLMVAVCLGAIRRRTIFPQETRKYSITDPDSLTGPRTPASATATGSKGNVFWDVNHIYVVTDANTWKRSPVYTWGSGYVPVEHINWTAAPNDFSTTGTISGGAITGTTYNGLTIQSAAADFTFTTSGGESLKFAGASPIGWTLSSPYAAGKVLSITASSALNQDVATTSDVTHNSLTLAGDTLTIATTKTPASASAVGTTGDMAWDSDYEYRCVATNTWKRVALSTWGVSGETMVYEDGNVMIYEDGNAMIYE